MTTSPRTPKGVNRWARLAYAEVLGDERGENVAAFLRRTIKWFARRGVRIERVLSDNGSGYRSRVVAAPCQALAVAQRWTRPYRPQTNGKAERFIQTLLREWAYRRPYLSSLERQAALPRWLHYYNWHRRHGGIQGHRLDPVGLEGVRPPEACTVLCETPVRRASSRVVQCVRPIPGGLRVKAMIWARFRALTVGGRPERGRSARPATPDSATRRRSRLTCTTV
jgi:integrase-like protein